MKKVLYIYVEGEGDVRFLEQFIKARFLLSFEYDSNRLKACSKDNENVEITIRVLNTELENGGIDSKKINDTVKEIALNNTPRGIESIILLDADTETHCKPPGGFVKRNKYMEELKSKENASFDFFLIPDNKNNGNLEDLLADVISKDGKLFYECLNKYMQCMNKIPADSRPIGVDECLKDVNKTKMSWYTHMMLGKKHHKKTGVNRDYDNPNVWDLENSSLNPLYDFLKQRLGQII